MYTNLCVRVIPKCENEISARFGRPQENAKTKEDTKLMYDGTG